MEAAKALAATRQPEKDKSLPASTGQPVPAGDRERHHA